MTSQDQPSAPSPNNRHQIAEYEKASLNFKTIGLIVQAIGLLGAIGSIWLLWAQVREQVNATELQVEAIKAQVDATNAQYALLDPSVYQDLMSKQLDSYKLFIDNPNIYGYIFGKQRIPNDKIPPEALNAAYYHLDLFQLIYSQRSRLPALQDENGADWISWKNTMAGAFQESPLLCDQLSDLRQMFGPDFVDYVLNKHDWCEDQQDKRNK